MGTKCSFSLAFLPYVTLYYLDIIYDFSFGKKILKRFNV